MKKRRVPLGRYRLIAVSALSMLGLTYLAGISGGTALAAAPAPRPALHAPSSVGPVLGKHLLTRPRIAAVGGRAAASFSSANWDGYAVTPNSAGTTYNHVQAQWVQPAVTCDPSKSVENAVFWVGLDGWGSNSVEQGGTLANCQNGTAQYETWWEMWPFNGLATVFAINAGDTIQASVTYTPSTSMFDIEVKDVTSGKTLSEVLPCQPGMSGCVRTSAEVISEDPGGGSDVDGLFYLPHYNPITYTGASVTDASGHTGTLSDPAWQQNQITEISSQNVTKQTTSALSSGGASFTTMWQAGSGQSSGQPIQAAYQTGNTAPSTNEIQPNIELVNSGSSPIPLSAVTIRYWFTEGSAEPLAYACDYAVIGCSNITGTFTAVSLNNADRYLQISFGSGAGSLAPGNTGIIQSRFWEADFVNMTQTAAYSFNAGDTTFALNPHITVYYNGTLTYGTEPG
jgi:hypothetical protein